MFAIVVYPVILFFLDTSYGGTQETNSERREGACKELKAEQKGESRTPNQLNFEKYKRFFLFVCHFSNLVGAAKLYLGLPLYPTTGLLAYSYILWCLLCGLASKFIL